MPKITKSHTTPHFEKQFNKLSKNIQRIAIRKILLFENNPLYSSLNTHKLKGELSTFWSFYINNNFRVLFRFLKNNEVIYYDIDNHDIYK
ncbi:type II toxin-antitoxin system mRNA interferase toxin, RelE/StbE family [Candidatus Wolfebacteria bacterium CG02_land_8_20_14_3_00_37_12]|uniref:Type II toxin-antitoxin system mRNA interferase toxin, RelE/StbE family n=2 Tax=Candidatus Wolfeibacteriota TaxID=1752735 RepID=A0A2M7Q7Z9_9BACT|nr:MAG: type II toxin-antitoxin system mRNA interferase toxin, RelE/StbE family [Candidatus Wolfebacteria bacterium CG02_land_8_20_14_3_00_37_12]PIY59232.1 MAG: type II toxin-antitoxin system mRNA interferase toxin, RelE/StbE family [Candidatus Wolfebacteria bacterium CG_4_10_14_0_8_um_filter_37_11]